MVTTVLTWAGCHSEFKTEREVESYSSFGEVIYRSGCQRVAYTGELAQYEAGERTTVDVSGSTARAVCVDKMPAPAEAPPKLKAIQKERDLLIKTVDAILPKALLDDMQAFLIALLPLNDDGTMEKTIHSVADLLDTMYKDPDFTPALARLAHRVGYRPTKTAAGLVHTIVEYPQIDEFLGKLLALIGPGGTAETEWKQVLTALTQELKTAQPVANPSDPERTLKLALNLVLSTHPDLGVGKPRPLVARDWRGLAQIALASDGTVPAPFVDSNGDGLADVDVAGKQFVDATGKAIEAPTPFPEIGALVDGAMRDSMGRALSAVDKPYYKYYDLDGTVIGGMSREALTLMDPNRDITLGLVHGAAGLLGPRATKTKMYMDAAGGMQGSLTYNGFDTDDAAVLDLLHAFIQILGDPNADQTLQTTKTLLTKHESATTRLVDAMFNANDRGKMHPEAQVPATAMIYDDLMPIVARILRVPGLAQDVVEAMKNPHVRGFAPMIARLMTARNQLDFDHTDNGTWFMSPNSLDGVLPVDRTKADTDYNRSLMQRIAHLIHDANGAAFCNKDNAKVKDPIFGITLFTYARCELFEIPDLALFYVLNMASDSIRKDSARPDTTYKKASFCSQIKDGTLRGLITVDGESNGGALLAVQTGIDEFKCFPTPAAMNRSLFLKPTEQSQFMQDTTDPLTCVDGDRFIDVHDKSIFAWETRLVSNPAGMINAAYYNDTFYDAVRPLVDAFAKHDECVAYDSRTGNCTQIRNAAKIFVDLLAMLHEHWSSPNGSYFGHKYQSINRGMGRYAFTDNIVSYEPLLAEILKDADLVPAVMDLSPILTSLTVDGTATGQPALPVLIATARYLFNPEAAPKSLAYRNGMTSTVKSDGVTPVARATPYYLLADAFAHRRAALDTTAPAQAGAWKTSTSALIDQMLTVEKVGTAWRFKNRRVNATTLILIDFIRDRMKSHAKAGDLENWIAKELTQDLTDVLGGPVFAALADFVGKVEDDKEARTHLYSLLQYLMNEADNDLAFQTALTTLADQVQMFLDDPDLVPVARVMGAAMEPGKGAVDIQLDMIKRARDVDPKKVILSILRNLYRPDADLNYPASNLADSLAEINRFSPGQGGKLDARDYKTLLGEVRDFLTDEQRGFTRFIQIVKNRGPKKE